MYPVGHVARPRSYALFAPRLPDLQHDLARDPRSGSTDLPPLGAAGAALPRRVSHSPRHRATRAAGLAANARELAILRSCSALTMFTMPFALIYYAEQTVPSGLDRRPLRLARDLRRAARPFILPDEPLTPPSVVGIARRLRRAWSSCSGIACTGARSWLGEAAIVLTARDSRRGPRRSQSGTRGERADAVVLSCCRGGGRRRAPARRLVLFEPASRSSQASRRGAWRDRLPGGRSARWSRFTVDDPAHPEPGLEPHGGDACTSRPWPALLWGRLFLGEVPGPGLLLGVGASSSSACGWPAAAASAPPSLAPAGGSPEMPRVLVVAYFFPPLGGGGVHRPLAWARYLPEYGWNVTVSPRLPAATSSTTSRCWRASRPATEVLRVAAPTAVALWRRHLAPSLRGRGRRATPRTAAAGRSKRPCAATTPCASLARFSSRARLVSRMGAARRVRAGRARIARATSTSCSRRRRPRPATWSARRSPARDSGQPHAVGRRLPRSLGGAPLPKAADAAPRRAPPPHGAARARARRPRARAPRARTSGRVEETRRPRRRAAPACASCRTARSRELEPPATAAATNVVPAPRCRDPGRRASSTPGTLVETPAMLRFLEASRRRLSYEPGPARQGRTAGSRGPTAEEYAARVRELDLADVVRFVGRSRTPRRGRLQREADVLLLVRNEGTGYEAMVPGKLYEYLAARRPIVAMVGTSEASGLARACGAAVRAPERRGGGRGGGVRRARRRARGGRGPTRRRSSTLLRAPLARALAGGRRAGRHPRGAPPRARAT